jgi:phosphotransferase system enzyme I (PtsI)
VVGQAFVLDSEEYRIPRRTIPKKDIKGAIGRFHQACADSVSELEQSQQELSGSLGDELTVLLQIQVSWIQDKGFQEQIIKDVTEEQLSPEYAVSQYFRKRMKRLEESGVEAFIQRINDLRDIEKRLIRNLLGEQRESISNLADEVILVARDLTPSETMGLDRDKILGIVTERGGKTSHTAILAASLQIPAVVGLEGITHELSGGDTLILDGGNGTVIINPDSETKNRYFGMAMSYSAQAKKLSEELKDLPSETRDGEPIRILANIEVPEEIDLAVRQGASGIGLYRTEFLWLSRRDDPSEEDHFKNYRKALNHVGDRKLVVRTCDLGADKMHGEWTRAELNPSLGTRAIRLSFERLDQFRIQLRALYRASITGQMHIMLPLISSVDELLQARGMIEEVKDELRREGREFDENIPVGMMVEVPSAAVQAENFAPHVDFFSIGTNDLIQYTLAVDRTNKYLAHLFKPSNPAVLRLLRMVFDAADATGTPVSVCGEMGSDLSFVLALVGMGMREVSVVPTLIPEVKHLIRSVTLPEAERIAEEVLLCPTARDVEAYLEKQMGKLFPDGVAV